MKIKVLASGSTGNCYWISDGKTSLLLEAGIPIGEIQRGCNFSIASLRGCLITHKHGDHAKTADALMKKSVDVYSSRGTATARRWNGHRLHIVKGMDFFEIGTFTIMAFDLEHDAAEPLGYFIISRETREKLLYITDTHYMRYKFEGLTHILCECNYCPEILMANVSSGIVPLSLAKRIMHSHMSIDTVLDMLRANDLTNLRQIYLLHLSDTNSDESAFKERVQRLTGAEVYACY